MTITRVIILPGPTARCADITVGLLGLVEELSNKRHREAPGTLPDRNLSDAIKHLSSAYSCLNATALLDAVAAQDPPNHTNPGQTVGHDGLPH